jgi:helicase
MRVRDLPLPDDLVTHYESAGIEELYPPQEAAVEAGICEGDRVVAAVPTASGKTFVAELAMVTADGPALYIVPLRALAREKYESFSELPGVSVGISTGDYDATDETLADHDVVVATSEKVDSAIRNGASWVDDLACVVVDEVHLLGAAGRGPTLEVTLATLQRRTPDVQVVALSATVDNPDEIAAWLDAALVESDWRPVDLRTGVYDPGDADGDVDEAGRRDADGELGTASADERPVPQVAFDDGTTLPVDVGPDEDSTAATVALAAEAVANGGQCLAFVRSRREAAALAERLADADLGLGAAPSLADDVDSLGSTDTDRRLADCVRSGVAFHHAGLRSSHRALVEEAFRRRELSVICATPTLAAGVNVPARRVVVRDLRRYTGSGMAWLPVLEVHQMCGRAGRPHLDPYGEAVLVGGDATDPAEIRDRYVGATPEAVESKLAAPAALRTHVLSVVASGFADSRRGVLDLLDATFYAHQAGAGRFDDVGDGSASPDGDDGSASTADLAAVVDEVVADLVEMGMIETGPATDGPVPDAVGADDGRDAIADGASAAGTTRKGAADDTADGALAATELGTQVSRQYLTPKTGARIVAGLRRVREMDEGNVTPLTALELVCHTPDMRTGYLGTRERAAVYQFARDHAAELTTRMGEPAEFEEWLEAVKTAMILEEYADGATVDELVDDYRVGPGDLESRLERVGWLLGAADALGSVVDVDLPMLRSLREAFEVDDEVGRTRVGGAT